MEYSFRPGASLGPVAISLPVTFALGHLWGPLPFLSSPWGISGDRSHFCPVPEAREARNIYYCSRCVCVLYYLYILHILRIYLLLRLAAIVACGPYAVNVLLTA